MVGKYHYNYEPFIDIEMMGNEHRSVLKVKAVPDRSNPAVYNVWSVEDFDTIYENVMEYWGDYQYEDHEEPKSLEEEKAQKERD